MDEASYSASVAQVFKRIGKTVERADPDLIEADFTSDMVTMTAPATGEKVIVNTQRALHQIWVAGQGAGIHFSRERDGLWRDDKGKGIELLAWVGSCVHSASGLDLPFSSTTHEPRSS